MNDFSGIIYGARCTVTNKWYVGETIKQFRQRIKNHKADAIGRKEKHLKDGPFQRAIRKYGFDSFEWKILCKCKDQKSLDIKEKYYITKYNSYENGYNATPGGTTLVPIYISFYKARKYARSLGLKSCREWFKYCRLHKPLNIPRNPQMFYKDNGWVDWDDWLDRPKKIVKPRYCLFCGIKLNGSQSKYCSKNHGYEGRKVSIKCTNCGSDFKVPKCRKVTAKFCSPKCKYDNWMLSETKRGKTLKRNCKYCGKEFTTFVSQDNVCCSEDCGHKARRRRETRLCAYCGKPFEVKKSASDICCSWKCRVARSKTPDWPTWKKILKECPQCGKEFLAKPHQLKRGRGKYCSWQCRSVSRKIYTFDKEGIRANP